MYAGLTAGYTTDAPHFIPIFGLLTVDIPNLDVGVDSPSAGGPSQVNDLYKEVSTTEFVPRLDARIGQWRIRSEVEVWEGGGGKRTKQAEVRQAAYRPGGAPGARHVRGYIE